MKRLYLILFLASFTTLAHSQDSTSTKEITGPKNVKFYSEFINSIPSLSSFKTQCDISLEGISDEMRNKNRPFTPAGYELLGKFLISNNYNVILCSSTEEDLLTILITNEDGSAIANREIKIKDCKTTVEIQIESKNKLMLITTKKGKTKIKSLELSDEGEIK